MGGARNALYLEISCCPPGCRKAREPPSLTPAKTGIASGGGAQLSPSLNTAPAQVAFSEPPDLGLSRGLLAGGSPEPPGAGGVGRGPSGGPKTPVPGGPSPRSFLLRSSPCSGVLPPPAPEPRGQRQRGTHRVWSAVQGGWGAGQEERPWPPRVRLQGPDRNAGSLSQPGSQGLTAAGKRAQTAGRPGGREQAPARRARPGMPGHMLARRAHGTFLLGAGGQGPRCERPWRAPGAITAAWRT